MQSKYPILFILVLSLTIQACASPEGSNGDQAQAPTVDVANQESIIDPTNNNFSEETSLCEDVKTTFDSAGLSLTGSRFISLDDPIMISAKQATWLESDDLVLGVVQNGEAHAFPVFQMVYHHIANTTVGGEPYLVTY